MATNDFVPFCATDTGTNLLSQAQYLADGQRPIGNQPGVARSKLANKALRQATYIASCIAQFLSNATGDDVLDDENQANVLATMAKVWPAPTGAMMPFAGSVAPTGFLLCQGQSLLRSAYPQLFAVIGTTYGAVDGTHFSLPDTRGVFLRGAGSQTIAGVTYTGTPGTAENDQFQGHHHNTKADCASINGGTTGASGGILLDTLPAGGTFYNGFAGNLTNPGNLVADAAITDGSNGTPRVGAETQPANISCNYIIKT